jgi:hypothetical protein
MSTGKIPAEVLTTLLSEMENMKFGNLILKISYHDGHPKFFVTTEKTFCPGLPSSGSHGSSGD